MLYMVVQVIAGLTAGQTFVRMTNTPSSLLMPTESTYRQALSAEFVYTFVLAFVVLSVATVKTPLSQYFGLTIGSCVTVGGIAIGNVSGGSLNPAVSTGISAARIIG